MGLEAVKEAVLGAVIVQVFGKDELLQTAFQVVEETVKAGRQGWKPTISLTSSDKVLLSSYWS